MSRSETTLAGAVNAVNSIVENQATTIARIQRALDGKAGQSSGVAGATFIYQSVPNAVRNFLAEVTYDPADMSISHIDEYFDGAARDKPLGKEITTDSGVLEIANAHGRRTIQTGTSATITDIAPPYGIAVNLSDGDITRAYKMCPADALRQINTPFAPNVRDLGGWACDGGTIKYGLLFRGGQPGEADREVLVDFLGIRHQFNLRGQEEAEEEGVAESPLGIRNHLYSTFAWYNLTNTTLWREMLTDIFEAISYGEPIFFHCSAGADRTGTMAFVLEGLLGVSRSDMDKDYELTSFSSAFVEHRPSARRRTGELKSLVTNINSFSGDTTRDKLVSFVKSLGFTADQINAFRAATIDGTPEVIT